MTDAVFPFPGGKSRYAQWILDQAPDHHCYVEVFGGAAGVLVNKPPSTVEIYNDLDGDLVQFFEVLRDRHDELVEWLETVPYSRELHEEWADLYYHGYRPSEPVLRAGQFFFLRYAQWGGIYSEPAGFGTSKVSSSATSFANKIDRLDEFAERFDAVTIENLSWNGVIEKYDATETWFYCDPPYVHKEGYYPIDEIDHDAFVECLHDCEGNWIVSYGDTLPDGFEDFPIVDREGKFYINSGLVGEAKESTEHLVLNFEPEDAV